MATTRTMAARQSTPRRRRKGVLPTNRHHSAHAPAWALYPLTTHARTQQAEDPHPAVSARTARTRRPQVAEDLRRLSARIVSEERPEQDADVQCIQQWRSMREE